MKKLVLVLLAGLLLTPTEMFAKKHTCKKILPFSSPFRVPAQYFISLYLDEDSGDLVICPNYDITGLNITITGNGTTYLNTTVSLSAGIPVTWNSAPSWRPRS